MAYINKKLGAALLANKLLTEEQVADLEKKAAAANQDFADTIRQARLVDSEKMAEIEAQTENIPYVNLEQIKVNERAMQNISKQAAATYRFFAFDQQDGKLLVAMDAPNNFQALEAVKFIARKKGLSPKIFFASKEGIDMALGGTAEVQVAIGSALRDFTEELEAANLKVDDESGIEKLIEAAPVTKVVAVIIRHAIEGHASDIHIEPTDKDLRVRYRVDGRLHTSLSLPKRIHMAIISRIKILSHLKIDESRLPQDGRFSSDLDQQSFDFRVSTMPTVYGEKVVLRILDKSQGAPSLDDLGLWGKQQVIFEEYLHSPHGIILISGPTGAGKSTTLFSALSIINTPEVNISTLEDPVEYEVDGVNQTQVNPDIGLSFASGLRNLLRQDPDILMVGEIRDHDTAALSIHASLTGHLVLSTIHTNDAVGAIPRLVDMGIDAYLLTATLRLLVAQRLVARLCDHCKQEQEISSILKEKIIKELASVPDTYKNHANIEQPQVIYTAKGCPQCRETGITGRLAIFEIVPVNRQLRDAINEEADYDILYDIARQQGTLTMRQDGIIKALSGFVQYEDVIRVTSNTQQTQKD